MRRLPFFRLGLLFFAHSAVWADAVLVVPFFNQSKSGSVDWIGESFSETIRESLASQGLLLFTRENRVEAYRRLSLRPNAQLTRASIIKLGEALDATQVIWGHYELVAPRPPAGTTAAPTVSPRDSLRVVARVLDLKHTRQGPEFEETGALEDLASLETRMAWRCLKFLAPKNAPSEEDFRRDRPALRLDAIETYIRGLQASAPDQKHRLFTQAARLDPRFSEPNFELGKMAWEKKDYAVAAGWLEKVSRQGSHYFEALFLLGLCRYQLGDFAGAEQVLQTVASSVPLNEVFNDLGAAQLRQRSPAALDNFHRALEGDAADPDYHFNVGYALWKRGEFLRAAESFRAVLDRAPEDSEAVLFLGRSLKRDGPRSGDPRSDGRERLKLNFEENAYRQLKAELESKP
jgi:tetratricopeptide (TPR) repeat protein